MFRSAQRRVGRLVVAGFFTALLAACGDSGSATLSPDIPSEVEPSCGRPGTTVRLAKVPVTIKHADCDLTGVALEYDGVGVTVPTQGGASAHGDGPKGGTSLTVLVAVGSKDVTVSR